MFFERAPASTRHRPTVGPRVVDGGPTLAQHLFDLSCLLGREIKDETVLFVEMKQFGEERRLTASSQLSYHQQNP